PRTYPRRSGGAIRRPQSLRCHIKQPVERENAQRKIKGIVHFFEPEGAARRRRNSHRSPSQSRRLHARPSPRKGGNPSANPARVVGSKIRRANTLPARAHGASSAKAGKRAPSA